MLKNYLMPNGHIYQYEESEAPASAVLYEPKKEKVKAVKPPANKARKVANK